jgi:uncharacterized membrane protein
MKYIGLTLISAIFFIIFEMLYKYSNLVTMPSEYFVAVWLMSSGIVATIYLFYNKIYLYNFKVNDIKLMFLIGILTFTGNLFYFNACKIVVNPGLSRAIFSGFVILLLTILSYLIFNAKITIYQIIGIIFIIIGILVIFIKSN